MNIMHDVITLILAGGKGDRLGPLTKHCAKPAVEFASKYSILAFQASSAFNSKLRHWLVLTQYRSHELNKYLADNWPTNVEHEFYVHSVPAQQLQGDSWYQGTANAVYQNLDLIESEGDFRTAAILSGDHVIAMDYRQMYDYHRAKQSVFTVCVMPVPTAEASRFGVLEVDADWRIVGFEEKPAQPKEIPGMPGYSLGSMGNYFAELAELSQWLVQDAERPDTSHDFGKDIIPGMLAGGVPLYAYNFFENEIPRQTERYWRDVGTIQALHDANMDLVRIRPELNLYNNEGWPIRSAQPNLPPAKFNKLGGRGCVLDNALASGGCIVESSLLSDSVLGYNVRVSGSTIAEAVLFSGVRVRNGCHLHRVIVDKGVEIPEGITIGVDADADRARGLYIDKASGIVVVPRGFVF